MFVIPSYVVPDLSEFPVTNRMLPASSVAGPYPDIQIDDRKKVFVEVACWSRSWFEGNGASDPAVHPSSQPRDRLGLRSQKLPNPA